MTPAGAQGAVADPPSARLDGPPLSDRAVVAPDARMGGVLAWT
jgi:hypothetical protein